MKILSTIGKNVSRYLQLGFVLLRGHCNTECGQILGVACVGHLFLKCGSYSNESISDVTSLAFSKMDQ